MQDIIRGVLGGKRPECSLPSLPWDVPSCRGPERQRPTEKGGWVTAKRALKSSAQALLRSTRVFLENLELFPPGAAVAEGLPCSAPKPSPLLGDVAKQDCPEHGTVHRLLRHPTKHHQTVGKTATHPFVGEEGAERLGGRGVLTDSQSSRAKNLLSLCTHPLSEHFQREPN